MDPFTMVVAIVGITAIASVIRAKYGAHKHRGGDAQAIGSADAERMRTELRALRDRVAVLERIATENDRGLALDREIEALRGRDRDILSKETRP